MQLQAKSSLIDPSHRQIWEQIEQEFGSDTVPQVFRLLQSQPVLLTCVWGQFYALVLHGNLPRMLKEMVGLVVATTAQCDYIHALLLHSLVQQCAEQETLTAIVQGNYQVADVSHATRAILRYANMAIANQAAHEASVKQARQPLCHHIHALDDTGLEEREQLELIATIALFEKLCTVATLLQLEPD